MSLFGRKTETPTDATTNTALVWRTEKRRIGDLVEWDANPRRLTEKQAHDLEESLRKFGYVEEIVVNADGRSIIGGHMRRKVALAAALLNPDAIIDVRVPSRPLTESEGIELAIRLNKNTAEWDFDMLGNHFDTETLVEWGFEPIELGLVESRAPVGDQSSDVKSGFDVIVSATSESAQAALLEELVGRGFTCRAVVY